MPHEKLLPSAFPTLCSPVLRYQSHTVSSALMVFHQTANQCRANDKRTIVVRQGAKNLSPQLAVCEGIGHDLVSEKREDVPRTH
jgi:hypothetical protein